MSTNTFSRILY